MKKSKEIGQIIKNKPLDDSKFDQVKLRYRELISWVWMHSRSELGLLILGMIAAIGVSSLSSVSLLYISQFIDALNTGIKTSEMIVTAFFIGLILLGSTLLKLASAAFGAFASTNIRCNLEITCFQHISSVPYEYLAEQSGGRLTSALMAEIPLASGIIGIILRSFIQSPITIAVISFILLYKSPLIGAVALISSPLLFIGVRSFSKLALKISRQTFENISQMYSKMAEQLAGVRIVQCLGLTNYLTEEMKSLSRNIAKTSRKTAMIGALQRSVLEIISMFIMLAFLWWLSWEVINGQMLIGEALIFPAGLQMIRNESGVITGGIIQLKKIQGATDRLTELLKTRRMEFGSALLDKPLERVKIENVSFGYKARIQILDEIDLELKRGCFTVIIGESGSGKSTLCDLLLRLRLPNRGSILFNNTDLKELDEEFLRHCTALVEQEPFLFESSVRKNLSFNDSSTTEEAIWDALRQANASEFVQQLPSVLNTDVGPKGIKLSVGQKQRLALARALIRKPQFLILDEFTSSLDLESEAEIMGTILKLSKDIIILCTTHRESVIRRAKKVYRIKNHRICEQEMDG